MVKVVHTCDGSEFETEVNALLAEGWSISSTDTCAAINSGEYDFCPSFTAVLTRD